MTTFRAYEVAELQDNTFKGGMVEKQLDDLPPADVLIRVSYSSVNYKDALSASGNKGVTRHYPHTPGIDAVGLVEESGVSQFAVGDQVIVTGYDLGMNTPGGFAEFIRVPAAWVVPLPEGLSAVDAMRLGTAGLTAAMCVDKLLTNGLVPAHGPVLVTGATGGVGTIALILLARLGFEVTASTAKHEMHQRLLDHGASNVIDRDELSAVSSRPLLKQRWAAAVDVVGGDTLVNVVKSLHYGASVVACGLVQSPAFHASVLPFILRGVNLLGVDSVELPLQRKAAIWQRLASDWKLADLRSMTSLIAFEELDGALAAVLQGRHIGRFVLDTSRP